MVEIIGIVVIAWFALLILGVVTELLARMLRG